MTSALIEWNSDLTAAPKDRRILLCYQSGLRVCGQWEPDQYNRRPRPYWRRDGSDKTVCRAQPPIAWMELP